MSTGARVVSARVTLSVRAADESAGGNTARWRWRGAVAGPGANSVSGRVVGRIGRCNDRVRLHPSSGLLQWRRPARLPRPLRIRRRVPEVLAAAQPVGAARGVFHDTEGRIHHNLQTGVRDRREARGSPSYSEQHRELFG